MSSTGQGGGKRRDAGVTQSLLLVYFTVTGVTSVPRFGAARASRRVLLTHETPNDRNGSKEDQNYNYDLEIFGFFTFDIPLCCYPYASRGTTTHDL